MKEDRTLVNIKDYNKLVAESKLLHKLQQETFLDMMDALTEACGIELESGDTIYEEEDLDKEHTAALAYLDVLNDVRVTAASSASDETTIVAVNDLLQLYADYHSELSNLEWLQDTSKVMVTLAAAHYACARTYDLEPVALHTYMTSIKDKYNDRKIARAEALNK